jgi:hypothetical protein
MSVLISFIIPACNAEKTIKNAVLSIVEQEGFTPENTEIIVVENGSTDKTTEIVLQLQKIYNCIRLIHSSKGVSCGRNAGLKEVKGQWIAFIDADDRLLPGAMCRLTEDALNTSVDMYVYGHSDAVGAHRVTEGTSDELFSEGEVEKCRVKMLENPTRYMQAWGKLIKRHIVDDNNLRFNEKLWLAEDSDFIFRYSAYCKKICFSRALIYNYSLAASSVMRSYDGRKTQAYIMAMEETKKHLTHESQTICEAYNIYVLMHFYVAMVRDVFVLNNRDSFIQKYRTMKRNLRESVFWNSIKNIPFSKCKSVRMLPGGLLKMHLYFFAALAFSLRAVFNARKDGSLL